MNPLVLTGSQKLIARTTASTVAISSHITERNPTRTQSSSRQTQATSSADCDVVLAPSAGWTRVVQELTFYNTTGVSATVTLVLTDGATETPIAQFTLASTGDFTTLSALLSA